MMNFVQRFNFREEEINLFWRLWAAIREGRLFSGTCRHIVRAAGDAIGVQTAARNQLGVNFWHDFRRLEIRNNYFLDVGANIGQWATDARIHYPNTSILSLEPEPEAFGELCRRFQNDRHHRAVRLAASSRAGSTELRIGKYPTTHSLEPRYENQSTHSVTVQMETIDRIAQQFDLERLTLLKIDVEGHEIECIKGGVKMLREGRIDTVLVEVGFSAGNHTPFAEVEKLLANNGLFFLAVYDLVLFSGYARTCYANAFFCRHGMSLT